MWIRFCNYCGKDNSPKVDICVRCKRNVNASPPQPRKLSDEQWNRRANLFIAEKLSEGWRLAERGERSFRIAKKPMGAVGEFVQVAGIIILILMLFGVEIPGPLFIVVGAMLLLRGATKETGQDVAGKELDYYLYSDDFHEVDG